MVGGDYQGEPRRRNVQRRQVENLSAERTVLGSVLRSPHLLHVMNGAFRPTIFTSERHQQIAVAVKALDLSNRPLSLEGVIGLLPPNKDDEDPYSHEGYLNLLIHEQTDSGIAEDLLSDLVEKAGRRRMAELGRKLATASMESDGRDPAEVLESMVNEAREDITSSSVSSIHIKDALAKAMDIANKRAMGQQAVGLSWFIDELNDILGLMEPGFLIAILADAKAGKSSFGFCLARHASNYGPVIVFSMEMKEWNVGVRLLSQESRVPEGVIYRGQFTDPQFDAIKDAELKLAKRPIELIDTPRLTMAQIRSKALEIKRRYGKIAFAMVDQLKVIRPERKYRDPMEAVPDHMAGLKELAVELDCPLAILMQRTRSSLNRPNPRPTSDDGFGGGSTKEGVDTMAGVWRKEAWLEEHKPPDEATNSVKLAWREQIEQHRGKAEIIGLARRYGRPNQSLMARFIGECGVYESFNAPDPSLVAGNPW